jgi:hypothetical protein
MSNNITTVVNGGTGAVAAQYQGLKTTITAVNGPTGNLSAPLIANSSFSFAQPSTEFKTGQITIRSGDGKESAEFDAAFINDLTVLLEIIQEVPDDHPLGGLKHDMRMHRAFKRLGG